MTYDSSLKELVRGPKPALFSAVQELRERNAKNQNRIHEYKTVEKAEIGSFHIGIVDKKYDDPYKQAEYAYGLIEENTNE